MATVVLMVRSGIDLAPWAELAVVGIVGVLA